MKMSLETVFIATILAVLANGIVIGYCIGIYNKI